ncbi:MAG: 50S ribosomal protein L11 [Thaumarchaeota archaeon]|nr:50S ribosomal protein L11 [Nitrososphaerota archaeon]
MGEQKTISALVVGGEATAGPPLGPALGPLGVNVMMIIKEINEKTKDYSGMRVPVKINVDTSNKQFNVEVGVPTAAALIAKEAGVPKGSGTPKANLVGNLTMEQVVKIAKLKSDQSYAFTKRAGAKEVVGSCVSMGIKVENQDPREVLSQIDEGKWDKAFKE